MLTCIICTYNSNELTWRDIQHLIVETSVSKAEVRGKFYENGAGKKGTSNVISLILQSYFVYVRNDRK